MSSLKRRCLVCIPLFFLPLFLLMILACESKMTDPGGTLKEQAKRYWTERLVNNDYQYTYKEELKEGLPIFATYEKNLRVISRFGVSSVKVEKVKIEGDQGTVTLQVACRFPGISKEIDVPLGDRWVIKGNQWKHLLPEMKTK